MQLPEARQCVNEASHLFGAVAVKVSENRFGYISPEHGGGYATLGEVQDWPIIAPARENEE